MLSRHFAAMSEEGTFSSLSCESLARIAAAARTLHVPAGRTIFRKGDPGDGCYLVLEGAVKVTLPANNGPPARGSSRRARPQARSSSPKLVNR